MADRLHKGEQQGRRCWLTFINKHGMMCKCHQDAKNWMEGWRFCEEAVLYDSECYVK